MAPPVTSPFAMFLDADAVEINRARLEHLAALELDLSGKRVLEVGAGIGLHTEFFENLGCEVLCTDGNPSNVAEIVRRFPHRNVGVLDLDRDGDWSALGTFDIVYCYGTLYHLTDPEGSLRRLAALCTGQILVETVVVPGNHAELHHFQEPRTPNQALGGLGTRPTRKWVMDALRRHFGHAYTTRTQPAYRDFVRDWGRIDFIGNYRAVFVGSKIELSLPTLIDRVVERHENAPPRDIDRPACRAKRIWIDVGAYKGERLMEAARADPDLLVYAFEPLPEAFEGIHNIVPNYVVCPMAVSITNGIATFHVNRFRAASSLLRMDEQTRSEWIAGDLLSEESTVLVPTTRLDTFMEKAGIQEIEFLKIDAQGADYDVVVSAGDRLRQIEKITMEVAVTPRQLYRGASSKDDVIRFMMSRGFELTEASSQSDGQEENLTFLRAR